MQYCSINNNDCKHHCQNWYLNNYFDISGYFCGYHYSMVSHDAYGLPRNKEAYEKMLYICRQNICQNLTRGDYE